LIKSHKDLEVWKRSVDLAKKLYIDTKDFPKEELYGLVNQIRRSAVSIASNIAEGKNRQHTKEFIQFLYIALGSSAELETQLIIAKELRYLKEKEENDCLEELDQIGKMIRGLIRSLH
jgi:four helix bundle protein